MKKKIAFINQRYGLEVNGGSELYTRQIAERLKDQYDVDVLTTCAVDFVTWDNYYSEGTEYINGVKVIRFKTQKKRDINKFAGMCQAILSNNRTREDEEKWLKEQGPFCPGIIDFCEKHYDEYDAFIVVTYIYYTAVKTIPAVQKKAIFIPTAHDEPFIFFDIYKDAFKAPEAFVFLTEEEKDFVQNTFNVFHKTYEVTGAGIDVPENVSEHDFVKKFHISGNYIIYVGRIDGEKGCAKLFQYFLEYKKRSRNDLKLVLMGKSSIDIPEDKDIIYLGFVSDEDKFNGIKGAKALILPSPFESLSISVLEALALSVPVIVNAQCKVLKGHCIRSNAGLYYNDYFEFEGALNYMMTHSDEYKQMCFNGVEYIKRYYRWDIIINKFIELIEEVSEKAVTNGRLLEN